MRIGIVGLGGVGGYFGGLLAAHYHESSEVEIVFIARPSSAEVIRKDGLSLTTPQSEQIIQPQIVASNAKEAGRLDLLICATKGYDLEESLKPLRDCIGASTMILPLLNGVDASERIAALYPEAIVLMGCAYIVSRRLSPGVIKETGSVHKIYFGSTTLPVAHLQPLQDIFTAAGIESYLSAQIESDVWEKFLFTAAMASSTCYFDETIGRVMTTPEHKEIAGQLVIETKGIADAKSIPLPEHIVEGTIEKLERMPYEATSSMHSDYSAGGKTEYRSLTEYVALQGDILGVETPTFDNIIPGFVERDRRLGIATVA